MTQDQTPQPQDAPPVPQGWRSVLAKVRDGYATFEQAHPGRVISRIHWMLVDLERAAAIASQHTEPVAQREAVPGSVDLDTPCVYCAPWPDVKQRHAKHLAYLWATTKPFTDRWQSLYEATERAIDAAATPSPTQPAGDAAP